MQTMLSETILADCVFDSFFFIIILKRELPSKSRYGVYDSGVSLYI